MRSASADAVAALSCCTITSLIGAYVPLTSSQALDGISRMMARASGPRIRPSKIPPH